MIKAASILLGLTALSAPTSSAQEITIDAITRSASVFAAVADVCTKFLSVNVTEAKKWHQVYLESGAAAYGRNRFIEALKPELKRRSQEIAITGPAQWCTYQQAHLEKLGAGKIFNQASASEKAKQFTCSGELWNISKDETGETWIEIGHGIYQCTVKDASSDVAKKILSVCPFTKRCTFRVEITAKTDNEGADNDNVVVTSKDTVLWVRSGAPDDTGYKGSQRKK